MAKKNNKIILLSVLIVLASVSSLVYSGISKNNLMRNSQISQSPLPTIFPDQQVQIPSDWKIKNEPFDYFRFTLTYNYPPDWSIVKVTGSGGGNPNYATIYNSDKSECIKFTVSQDFKNIDNEISNVINGWSGTPLPDNSITRSKDVTIDGKSGKIEMLDFQGNKFFVAAVDLNINRNPDSVFAVLTSCSLKELNAMNLVFHSIKIK